MEGLTYGFFISAPQPHRGLEAESCEDALVTSISQPHSGFMHTNRWPFLMPIAMNTSPESVMVSRRTIAVYSADERRQSRISVDSSIELEYGPLYNFPMREQRRSRRILASIPLQIESQGRSHRVLTAVINLNGALILSSVNWPEDSDLRIKNPDTGLEIRGRVVWCGSQASTGSYKLGVDFETPSLEFWGEHYDPQGVEVP